MKKMYLMKGMALLAMGLVAASCNKADFDQGAYQKAKETESREKFINNVMGGQEIDPNQTWSTTTACNVSVTPDKSGTLKIYPAYPIGNTVASLYTANVSAGQPVSFTVAKPIDLSTLYVAIVDDNEMIVALDVINANGDNAEVDMTRGGAVTRGATHRAAMPAVPTFRDTNPIVKPAMPSYSKTVPSTAKYAKDYQNYQKGDVIYINTEYQTLNNPQNTEDLTIYVDGEVTYCGGTNQNGNGTVFCVTENSTLKLGAVSNNLTVYLAPGATLDITEGLNWDGTPAVDYVWNAEKNANDLVPKTSFSFQNPHAAIYLNSGSKVTATDLTLINGAKVLNNGGTIEATNLTLDQNATLWNAGTIKVTKKLTLANTSSSLYNKQGKTIKAATIDLINNDALLFNEGTVKATGAIKLHNTNAEIINYGTLTGASFSSAAGGKMHNEGTGVVTIKGKTDLTNSNSTWMNDGQWTCGSFDVDNYSHTNINNCRLTVNGNFHLNRGTFVLGAESGVVCESFTWEDTSDFYLGSNSVLKIKGDLLTKNYNSGYGFRGPDKSSSDAKYAVIEAARIYHEGNEQFRMSYYGKLYVATDSHFDIWYKDAPNTNQPSYWTEESVVMCDGRDAAVCTIDSTDCNPGYYGKKKDPDPIMYYYYAFEDLGSIGDFDFNDVVLRVSAPNNGESTVDLMAAGGTLKSKVVYGDQTLCNEVHEAFDIELVGGNSDMVNTGYTKRDFVSLGTVAIAEGADMANLPFGIVVTGNDGSSIKVTREVDHKGTAPLMIVVSGYPKGDDAGKWFWAKERVNISVAYPQFGAWGANVEENQDWYLNYVDGSVWKY